ncbi:MAG: DUF4159 domain-containing protein [Planctomycetaceae bacterium]|nr:DUF4159 domain-containing protein [Planctomycetaceae bacterium]
MGQVGAPVSQDGSLQLPGGRGQRGGRYGRGGTPTIDRTQYPQWQNDPNFQKDVFTFARLQYDGSGNTPDARWNNDFPDADLNLSFRLQQLTSLHVNPDAAVVRLDDPKLFEYPFLFMIGVTGLNLNDTEARTLRQYLLSGGFLMVDDFWTPAEWRHIRDEMKKVFPETDARELPPEHPIFHLIYDLKGVPRVPSIRAWQQGHTFEYWHGDTEGDEAPHFMAYYDGQGRMVALMCHNNDICDGWEREGENHEYFKLFSEKWSYPLGINIIVYALTH